LVLRPVHLRVRLRRLDRRLCFGEIDLPPLDLGLRHATEYQLLQPTLHL